MLHVLNLYMRDSLVPLEVYFLFLQYIKPSCIVLLVRIILNDNICKDSITVNTSMHWLFLLKGPFVLKHDTFLILHNWYVEWWHLSMKKSTLIMKALKQMFKYNQNSNNRKNYFKAKIHNYSSCVPLCFCNNKTKNIRIKWE